MLFSDEQEILNQVLDKRRNIDNIKHDEVKRVISELYKFSDTIFSFDPVTGENEICKEIYLSDYYRIRDAIHLLQHYDDLLTIIRKD
jgi:ACT domain-containing protein